MSDEALSDVDRSGAMLAHLSGYAGYAVPCGGILAPLIIAFTVQSRAVAAVARQALLLNVLGFLSLLPAVGLYLLAGAINAPAVQLLLVVATSIWVILVVALVVVCPLVGAIKASGGRYYRYPIFGLSMPQG